MSHKKDIERAKSGLVFRDGQLRRKEIWDAYSSHRRGVALIATAQAVTNAVVGGVVTQPKGSANRSTKAAPGVIFDPSGGA